MSGLKTRRTGRSVSRFLAGVEHPVRRKDARTLLRLMREVTGLEPEMWGDSIVGFGRYQYRYASGREGDWFLAGFSPRKSSLVLYLMSGQRAHAELLRRLGQAPRAGSCLYLKSLDGVDLKLLRRLIRESVAAVRRREREATRAARKNTRARR